MKILKLPERMSTVQMPLRLRLCSCVFKPLFKLFNMSESRMRVYFPEQ